MTESFPARHAPAIVENCPFPLLLLDRQGRVIGCNRAFERLVGADTAAALRGRSLQSVEDESLKSLFRSGSEVGWNDREGGMRHFEIHRSLLPQTEGMEMRLFVDVSGRVALQRAHDALKKELERHTLTDPTTGLLNERGIMLALEPQVARSRRYNNPMAVIMMEVHGGEDRPATLREAARLLRDQLRWADLVGSSDQQEFILVLPETSAESALRLSEKLRIRLQETLADSLWIGAGVTGWQRNDSATSLLRRAAMALSEARSAAGGHPVAL